MEIPGVDAPDNIIVSMRIYDSKPYALGQRAAVASKVGSYLATWVENAPGRWTRQDGSIAWAVRIEAASGDIDMESGGSGATGAGALEKGKGPNKTAHPATQ